MRIRIVIFFAVLSVFSSLFPLEAWGKWEFVNPSDIEIRISPDREDVFAGTTATFTITIRNKTDKKVTIYYPTGQRWDMAAYHDKMQIWRWSQGMDWAETPHSIDIRPDFPEKFKISWRTVDRAGGPLPQGLYRVQGMVMTVPRHLVSNMTDIHLLPPKAVNQGVMKVKPGQTFKIEFPRWAVKDYEIDWRAQYVYNDNRVEPIQIQKNEGTITWFFRACRRGHVVIHFFGKYPTMEDSYSLERRTYKIDIVEKD